jgi:hypothetical protein
MGCNSGKKCSTSEKKQYSMIEVLAKISSILQLYCILKYIHKKMYVVEKKSQVGSYNKIIKLSKQCITLCSFIDISLNCV